ncbi:universal stress protein [Defluviimonas sp. WL0024]|uniref:Universal stress protein n=1 Tax=Albidovulum salinarum TaxID=2984153 RepID=A0ABT2X8K1_9RHOB|nr:universal stress protein [Defluviimonas sp. WL0024]MCU9850277.1 universal stress protein [Defluviimonas sp. WL0024]
MANIYVAGYDGSTAGRRAVDYAVARAEAAGAELLVAHVLEWSPYSFLTPEEIAERHKRRTQELKRAESAVTGPLAADLSGRGVKISTEIRYGHVAETLCEIAKEHGALQIFIGRTGHSTVVERLFGSVAGTLAQIAPVPCTIVP